MFRNEYYHDVDAPAANSVTPTAFAVARDDAGWVLLVRRADTGLWELPGGRVELGESATVAAEREVAEESGVTVKVTRLAGVYTDPPATSWLTPVPGRSVSSSPSASTPKP